MRKISKKSSIESINSSYAVPVKVQGGRGSIVDGTKRGMLCEGCGKVTHRVVWKNHQFYCKECVDADRIRKRQNEIARGWD